GAGVVLAQATLRIGRPAAVETAVHAAEQVHVRHGSLFDAGPRLPRMSELACLDGQIASAAETFIPATDEGLLRGDGVFEVIRVYHGVPFALTDHLTRIESSAASLRLELPQAGLLREETLALIEQRGPGFDGCIRL